MTGEQDRHRMCLLYDAARLERAANRAIGWGFHDQAERIMRAVVALREAADPPKPVPPPMRAHPWRGSRAVAPKRAKGVQ
jgi:hypothetical protein